MLAQKQPAFIFGFAFSHEDSHWPSVGGPLSVSENLPQTKPELTLFV